MIIIIIPTTLSVSYRKTVPESIGVGSIILTVNATDNDIPPNNMICYSILAEVIKMWRVIVRLSVLYIG